MTQSRPHSFPARWTFLLCALSLSASTSFGQSVGGFILGKIQNFQQTSSAVPVVNSTQPFQFGAIITMGTATINSATLNFSGSSNPRAFTAAGNGDFSILDTFTTQAQLDAAYGSGNYTVNINTSAGLLSRTIFLFPFSYPITPRLTVPAADWQNNALVVDPMMDYTFTWGAFSNAQTADLIQLIIRNSAVSLSPFPATQTSYTLPAGSLQAGTDYVCDLIFVRVAGATAGDTNIGAGYATLVKDTGFTIHTPVQALALTAAVSRKTHGAAGSFDMNLPGVECRTGGATGDHTLVITFNNPVVSGNATVTSGTGSVAGAPLFSNNTMTVNLTGIANAQTVTITLSDVTDSSSQVLPDTMVNAGFLLGDSNGDGFVNAGDALQTRNRSGQPTDANNFRSDVNIDGSINSGDALIARSRSGTALP